MHYVPFILKIYFMILKQNYTALNWCMENTQRLYRSTIQENK